MDPEIRSLMLGDAFPNIECQTSIGDLKLHEYQGKDWLIFFSHPKDFTPVCTTELGRASKLLPEFTKRNCKMVAISCDSAEDHVKWIKDINETQGTTVTFPIIGDLDLKIAKSIGMVHPNLEAKITVRTTYIIDPDHKVKIMIQYPPSCGRNFDEILRVLDSLQLTVNSKVATPENWKQGDKCVIIPSLSNEEAKVLFPQGWEEVKPYLRLVDLNKK
jgi:alkyl hydroperoxide reductase subunit AhpC